MRCGTFEGKEACIFRQAVNNPLPAREQTMVLAPASDQLQPCRKAFAAACEREMHAGKSQQGPTAAKQWVAGGVDTDRGLAGSAGREQHVELIEQGVNAMLCHFSTYEIGGMCGAGNFGPAVQ